MPSFGFEYGKWAPIITETDNALPTYGVGRSLGGAVSGSHTPNSRRPRIILITYLKPDIKIYQRCADTHGRRCRSTDARCHYGATYAAGQVNHKAFDKPPFGGISW